MTDNGAGQTYEWDAINRLTKITYTGGARTELTYDGLDRRVKIVEKNSGGSVTSEKRFVWDGLAIAEERDGSNSLTKRFYEQGVMAGSDELYYTTDHLGSIRELTDDAGAIQARYDYDPYGRVTKISGSGDADLRYTGHYFHANSALHLAPYRAYDAGLGRWLSRDPFEEGDGPNLYGYVGGNPISMVDPDGNAAVIAVPVAIVVLGGAAICMSMPGCRQAMIEGMVGLHGAYKNWLRSQSTGGGKEKECPAPTQPAAKPDEEAKAPDRSKGDRAKSADDALGQLEEIEKAQQAVRDGKLKKRIDSIEKSRQRANKALRDAARDATREP